MPPQISLLPARLGATPDGQGTRFRVWAPRSHSIKVVSETGLTLDLAPRSGGFFEADSSRFHPGMLYRYQIDGKIELPDPASRFQPHGVHGPSEIVDLSYPWSDQSWKGIRAKDAVIYELHVGAFSPEANYDGVIQKLPYLRDLGITVVELMPLAAFPGNRNWGYDGTFPFAPAAAYGPPSELQRLVDRAHSLGLAVILDVVYNHLGPDGNYLGLFSDFYSSSRHKTIWGPALNYDGPHASAVRQFFLQSAFHWLRDYHFDGLRLDATHAIIDDSPRHFVAELSARCREEFSDRTILLYAEDHRRHREILLPTTKDGWGMDGVWADDFHHHMRRRLAGDKEGYFEEYTGEAKDITLTVKNGWWVTAGTTADLLPQQFIFCLQNHDQVGNRAMGERLHHQIDFSSFKAATCLFLCSPHTPLLFMGQEWAASSPFLYFTDHNEDLGAKVVEGRRNEFRKFSQFNDPALRASIPSPQDPETFLKSRLDWGEQEEGAHEKILKLHRALIRLRRSESPFVQTDRHFFDAEAASTSVIVLRRDYLTAASILVVVNLERAASVDLASLKIVQDVEKNPRPGDWEVLLSTEMPEFEAEPVPPVLKEDVLRFSRPGAVIYRMNRIATRQPR